MRDEEHQKSSKFFKDLEPPADINSREDAQQGVVATRKIKFTQSRNPQENSQKRITSLADLEDRRLQRFKSSILNRSVDKTRAKGNQPSLLSQFETYVKTDIGALKFQKKTKTKESPKNQSQKILQKLEPDPIKVHKEML